MNPDGSTQTNLTNNNLDDSNAAWSPDGTKIVFMSYGASPSPETSEIFVMNADGSGQTRLTNNPAGDFDPVWSPDGSKILFESDRDVPAEVEDVTLEIYVMNADGSGQTRLTNNGVSEFDPTWSPNGSKILFESDRDGDSEVYVMNPDGTAQTNLTNNDAQEEDPEWSPDGSKIVFESNRDETDRTEIYVMNANGSGQTRLTNNTFEDYLADCCYQRESWSPDGSKLVFLSDRDGDFEIFVMSADGGGQTKLTSNTAGDWDPAWSPDGTRIVFESERDFNTDNGTGETMELYVMNSDGTGQTRLTNNTVGDTEPEWQVAVAGPTPDTSILTGPKRKTTKRTATFTFSSTVPGATFECRTDTAPFAPCTSPTKTSRLSIGRHTFEVRASSGGSADPTPATKRWKVIPK
jgi:Tol biopolymer transport system component